MERQLEKDAGANTDKVRDIIFEWKWHLKKKGLAENTIYEYGLRIYQLSKESDLLDPEAVKGIIARHHWSNSTKAYTAIVYNEFTKWMGRCWTYKFLL